MNVQYMAEACMSSMPMPEAEADRLINLYCCLMGITDPSVLKKVRDALVTGDFSKELSESECSALAFCLLTADEVQDVLNAGLIRTTQEGKQRLISAVQNIKKAVFERCSFSDVQMRVISSALSSTPSNIRDLDLRHNVLSSSGLDFLCDGLKSPNCELESLTLSSCGLSAVDCEKVASALKSNPSHCTSLSLDGNKDLSDSGVKSLSDYLQDPDCRLEQLFLMDCGVTKTGCSALASALTINIQDSSLMELYLMENNLSEEDVAELIDLKNNPDSRLQILRF